MVMTCIDNVSCFVLMVISCILCVQFIIWSLDVCATIWKAFEVWMLVCWLRNSNYVGVVG